MQSAATRVRDSDGNFLSPSENANYNATVGSTPNELELIFQSVRRQIERWGESAKWKIDLVLLEKDGKPTSPAPKTFAKPSIRSSNGNDAKHLPTSATSQHPWDYTPPGKSSHETRPWAADQEMQRQLRDAMERQFYLENVVRSQSEQMHQPGAPTPGTHRAVQTMHAIYLLSEKEYQQRYETETRMLRKDIEALLRKQRRLIHTLQHIEKMDVPNEEELKDRDTVRSSQRTLLRKLHLASLRLQARDAEINYLHDQLRSDNRFGVMRSRSPKPPMPQSKSTTSHHASLPQQQYSPKLRSEVRRPHIGLDSLGILADQMLNQPEFDSTPRHVSTTPRAPRKSPLATSKQLPTLPEDDDPAFQERRSKRSIDSANALLDMPRLLEPISVNEGTSHKKARPGTSAWTPEEDALLSKGVKRHGLYQWDVVAQSIPDKVPQQCQHRWTQLSESKQHARSSPSIASLLDSKEDWQARQHSPAPPPGPLDAELSPRKTPPLHHHQLAPHSLYQRPKDETTNDRPPSPMRTPKNRPYSAASHGVS